MDSIISTETILESINDGVFTVDVDWNITSFNRAAEKITGINRKQAIGLRCSEVFKSNMCENHCPLVKTFTTKDPIINRTGYIVDLTGKRIPVSVSTALLKDDQGKVVGGAETFRDLSELEELRKLRARKRLGDIASNSPSMHKVMDMIPAVAESSSTVLLMGETGTGKEILAQTIHACSQFKDGPFIAVNCGSLPDSLLESELFGYRKGAFTGADRDKPGRFQLAQNGTLFLDEIGEISPAMQVKLLRVLQEQEYEPLGAVKTERTNARIICATNRDLEKMVAQGNFRQDFYYRIHVIPITVPPLRERREDIPLLTAEFLQHYGILNNKTVFGVSPGVFTRFYTYRWPGNVRELENVIERAVVLCSSETIGVADLPAELSNMPIPPLSTQPVPPQELLEVDSDIHNAKKQTERQYIEDSLVRNQYRVAAVAAELGWHRTTLYRKIKALSIDMQP